MVFFNDWWGGRTSSASRRSPAASLSGVREDHMLKESLTQVEKAKVAAARRKAFLLYEGKVTPHRSCGIALAETFGLPTRPYQSLRRGGITGEGECGAIKAGELILGELLGDPSPTGPPTPVLREAARVYREEWMRRVDRGPGGRTRGGGGRGPIR